MEGMDVKEKNKKFIRVSNYFKIINAKNGKVFM